MAELTEGCVEVRGCPVRYRWTGPVDAEPVLLVHGGAAHAGWWAAVAPVLASRHRVVLLDLSGHGSSGHRGAYGADVWAAEVAAVIERTGSAPAAVVGHSMGGLVGVAAAARTPDLVASLVLVDTRFPLRGLPPPTAPARHYASAAEALARFRLLPEQTSADPALLTAVATAGLVEAADGWRWRFDPAARRRFGNDGVLADLAALHCPVGYAYGAESDMGGPRSLARLEKALGRPIPSLAVPGAFHHVPLDRPVACARAIERLLPGSGQ